MNASCIIAIHQKDGKYQSINCNLKGSHEEIWSTLHNYYNNKNQVEDLISLGNTVYLGNNTFHVSLKELRIPWDKNQPKISENKEKLDAIANGFYVKRLYIFQDERWNAFKI